MQLACQEEIKRLKNELVRRDYALEAAICVHVYRDYALEVR